jgi:hypothetical protein
MAKSASKKVSWQLRVRSWQKWLDKALIYPIPLVAKLDYEFERQNQGFFRG